MAGITALACRRPNLALAALLVGTGLACLVRHAYSFGVIPARFVEVALVAGMLGLVTWLADRERGRRFAWLLAFAFAWLLELVEVTMGFLPQWWPPEAVSSAPAHLLGPGAPYFDVGVTGLLYLVIVGYGWGTKGRAT